MPIRARADQAIEIEPDYAEVYVHRATAYAKLGQHERVQADFDWACLKPEGRE